MPLPVQSVRASSEHRDVLTRVSALLKEGRADELRRLLDDLSEGPVGPFRSERAALAFLRDRLVACLRPEEIWLFGSRARGQGGPRSDFDLLVVLPDGLPETAYGHQAVAAPLVACGLPYDVVGCSKSEFRRESGRAGTLAHAAVAEGRRLYPAKEPVRRATRAA